MAAGASDAGPAVSVRPKSLPALWPDTAALAAAAAVFLPVALLRSIDGDEGSYLLAAKLAAHGDVPYRDFIYPQMPLLPYVYGAWSLLAGESWYAARLLSALLAIALAAVLYAFAARRFGRRLALLGLTLFLSSSLVFGWLTVVKTYALSTLALFVAYALVEREETPAPRSWLLAGMALGIAIDTRLLFVAAVPAFALAAWRKRRRARLPALPLAAGLAAGLLPSFFFLAWHPSSFLFDNLQAQGTRSSSGLIGDFPQKARLASNLLGFGTTEGVVGSQFLLLLVAVAAAVAAGYALRARLPLALVVAALLAVASFLPTPTYPQYFAVTIPFLVIAALELVDRVARRPALAADRSLRLILGTVLGAAAGLYVLLAGIDLHRYLGQRPFDARISTVERVAAQIEARTKPGEEVLASWPGYLYGTHAEPVPGLENDFSPHNSTNISAAKARRYRLATISDVDGWIRSRRTRLIVFRLWGGGIQPRPHWESLIRRSGYRMIAGVGDAALYEAMSR